MNFLGVSSMVMQRSTIYYIWEVKLYQPNGTSDLLTTKNTTLRLLTCIDHYCICAWLWSIMPFESWTLTDQLCFQSVLVKMYFLDDMIITDHTCMATVWCASIHHPQIWMRSHYTNPNFLFSDCWSRDFIIKCELDIGPFKLDTSMGQIRDILVFYIQIPLVYGTNLSLQLQYQNNSFVYQLRHTKI